LIVVPDASVAVKWVVSEDPGSDELAADLLGQIVGGRSRAVVPELFFFELLAVLCRRLGKAALVTQAVDRIARLGMARLALDQELARRASELAFAHGLTGYDAAYLAVAQSVRGRWATFDREAHKRVAKLGLSFVPGRTVRR
jgi:predicted nucleic acid-binding protein